MAVLTELILKQDTTNLKVCSNGVIEYNDLIHAHFQIVDIAGKGKSVIVAIKIQYIKENLCVNT